MHFAISGLVKHPRQVEHCRFWQEMVMFIVMIFYMINERMSISTYHVSPKFGMH
jgi:hypothetical protein